MEYQVVSGCYIVELVEAVKHAIREGWEPLGGVATMTHPMDSDIAAEMDEERRGDWAYAFYQAMIRRKPGGDDYVTSKNSG